MRQETFPRIGRLAVLTHLVNVPQTLVQTVMAYALAASLATPAHAAPRVSAHAASRVHTRAADSTVVASARSTRATAADLQATSEPPWNPPRALPRREMWERAVLFPGRLASLPLAGLGRVTETVLGGIEDSYPGLLTGSPIHPVRRPGLMLNFASLGDHTGIGGAVRVSRALSGTQGDDSGVNGHVEYQGTTRRYNRTTAGLAAGHADLEYGYGWRPDDQFYGLGLASSPDHASDYALQSQWARATVHYGWDRDGQGEPARVEVRAWDEARSDVLRTGRDASQESFERRFPDLAAGTLDRGVKHDIYGISLASDQLRGKPHWSHGWRAEASAERHDVPLSILALSSGTARGAQFTRYSLEAETGVSFMRDPRTLRVLVRAVDQQVSGGSDRLLPGDRMTLGGQNGLAGYPAGRFHDLDLVLGKVSYLLPLARLAEMDLHTELGGVYPDLWHDATVRSLRSSVGFSVRARSDARVRGAIGADFSRDGVELQYTLGRLP